MPQAGGWNVENAYGFAAKYVAAALAKDDPAGALAVARTIKQGEEKATALLWTAPYQMKDTARQMISEAAVVLPTNTTGTKALCQLASLAYRIDPATGAALFAQARNRVATEGENSVTFAYYYRVIDPAESRLWLEAAYRELQQQPDANNPSWSLMPVALAMAPLDFDRAEEIARSIPVGDGARFDTQRKLAQFLLAPDDVRESIPLDRWTCSDTWRPGTPTNW
jgi:hypothetical protein